MHIVFALNVCKSDSMATNIPRSLPFSCWDEWISVKSGLFSGENLHVALALETVALWRVRGRMPLSVDSTAHLIELRLRDSTANQHGYHRHSESELKLLYSAVIVRAVNGLVDPNQQGIYATSVLTLAERMGLPGWIVELRHDATHNQMPSLSVLRTAAATLVNWFYDFYWMPQLVLLQNLSGCSFPSSSGVNNNLANTPDGCATPDSSPTFVTEIFVPLFISSTVKSSAVTDQLYSVTDNAEAFAGLIHSETTSQSVLWMPRLKELCKASPHAVHSLVHGVLHAVAGILSSTTRFDISKPQAQWELKVAHFWLGEMLAGKNGSRSGGASASAPVSEGPGIKLLNVASAAPFVECLVQHIQSMEGAPQLGELKQEILLLVQRAYCIGTNASTTTILGGENTQSQHTTSTITSGSKNPSATGKRKADGTAPTSAPQSALKKSSATPRTESNSNRSCGIVRLDNYPMWPMGSVPVDFTASQLYLVEDVV